MGPAISRDHITRIARLVMEAGEWVEVEADSAVVPARYMAVCSCGYESLKMPRLAMAAIASGIHRQRYR